MLNFFKTKKAPSTDQPEKIKEAISQLDSKACIVLDIREERERRKNGCVKGSTWVATSKVKAQDPQWNSFIETAKSKQVPVYVFCAAGVRAQMVSDLLDSEGVASHNIGGFSDWKEADGPTEHIA